MVIIVSVRARNVTINVFAKLANEQEPKKKNQDKHHYRNQKIKEIKERRPDLPEDLIKKMKKSGTTGDVKRILREYLRAQE